MTESIRPLLLGYIREDVLWGERLASAQTRLANFAHSEGFALGTIFVERSHTAPRAFDALMEEIHRGDEAWAIVIPEAAHLNDVDHPAMGAPQEDCKSMTVLVAHASSP